jgi:hypothetical protein
MRKLTTLVVLACVAPAFGAIGDAWVLPIDHLGNPGFFTTLPGVGYGGADAVNGIGPNGEARVYWSTGNIIPVGGAPAAMPTATELYSIRFYAPASTAGGTNWQPIESQFNGVAGETYPMEAGVPWNGAFGTNHQYMAADGAADGAWHANGPGPHSPEDATLGAGANGTVMWLKGGTSWLYAKWDYPWSINRAWSAIELTQITPEPTTLAGLGLISLLALRRRNAR